MHLDKNAAWARVEYGVGPEAGGMPSQIALWRQRCSDGGAGPDTARKVDAGDSRLKYMHSNWGMEYHATSICLFFPGLTHVVLVRVSALPVRCQVSIYHVCHLCAG